MKILSVNAGGNNYNNEKVVSSLLKKYNDFDIITVQEATTNFLLNGYVNFDFSHNGNTIIYNKIFVKDSIANSIKPVASLQNQNILYNRLGKMTLPNGVILYNIHATWHNSRPIDTQEYWSCLIDDIENEIKKFPSCKIIIIGDFNIDNVNTPIYKNYYKSLIDNHGFSEFLFGPTYKPTNCWLDRCLLLNLNCIHHQPISTGNSSDHEAIYIEVQ